MSCPRNKRLGCITPTAQLITPTLMAMKWTSTCLRAIKLLLRRMDLWLRTNSIVFRRVVSLSEAWYKTLLWRESSWRVKILSSTKSSIINWSILVSESLLNRIRLEGLRLYLLVSSSQSSYGLASKLFQLYLRILLTKSRNTAQITKLVWILPSNPNSLPKNGDPLDVKKVMFSFETMNCFEELSTRVLLAILISDLFMHFTKFTDQKRLESYWHHLLVCSPFSYSLMGSLVV